MNDNDAIAQKFALSDEELAEVAGGESSAADAFRDLPIGALIAGPMHQAAEGQAVLQKIARDYFDRYAYPADKNGKQTTP
jgi:hypothetical protein